MPFFPNSYDKANFSMDITGPKPSGWFKYSLKQTIRGSPPRLLIFESSSITAVSLSENRATIMGAGSINGTGTYTFRATIVDESPDKFAIILYTQDGKTFLDAKLDTVVEGDLVITTK